jgi:hypothetical protein
MRAIYLGEEERGGGEEGEGERVENMQKRVTYAMVRMSLCEKDTRRGYVSL